jgi:hypothetical protein
VHSGAKEWLCVECVLPNANASGDGVIEHANGSGAVDEEAAMRLLSINTGQLVAAVMFEPDAAEVAATASVVTIAAATVAAIPLLEADTVFAPNCVGSAGGIVAGESGALVRWEHSGPLPSAVDTNELACGPDAAQHWHPSNPVTAAQSCPCDSGRAGKSGEGGSVAAATPCRCGSSSSEQYA